MVLITIKLSNQIPYKKEDHRIVENQVETNGTTWLWWLRSQNIEADPELHFIKGSSNTHTAQLGEVIHEYYSGFKKQLVVYKVDLKRKSPHQLKYDKLLKDKFNENVVPIRNINSPFPGGLHHNMEENVAHFQMEQIPPNKTPRHVPEYGEIHYNMRVEDTQEGNKVSYDNQQITDHVRYHFQKRISNKDILAARKELEELKYQQKYFALTRAAPFTAGLLENLFLNP